MIRKLRIGGRDAVEVTFVWVGQEFEGDIFVAGDFNDWDPTATPLQPLEGRYEARIVVLPGRHPFRYYSGGSWFNDPAADDYGPNEFSGLNGIVDTTRS